MARSLRIQYPGAYYHVLARGNRREPIVLDDVTYVLARTAWCGGYLTWAGIFRLEIIWPTKNV